MLAVEPGVPYLPQVVAAGTSPLCLLRVPLAEALSEPDAGQVAATVCRGGVMT
jgi:hypothetical protein